MYLGLLAIPEASYCEVLERLAQDRRTAGYTGEVHFSQLRNYSYAFCHNEKTLLAKHWVERVLHDDHKVFHFYLLGLNLDNLEQRAFGAAPGHEHRIYNRFFRASVAGMLKHFFPSGRLVVSAVFHDKSELQHHALFDWHTIWRLDSDSDLITFIPQRIEFIDSDHRREPLFPEDSHLIQLCDVLLGGLTQCLDARNVKDGCCEIASLLLPLAERLVHPRQAHNPNSHYRHWRRVSMSFFPSRKLKLDDLHDPYARAKSRYYHSRQLLLREYPGVGGSAPAQLALPM